MVNSHNVLRRDGSYPLNNMRLVQYDRDTFIEESGMQLLEF